MSCHDHRHDLSLQLDGRLPAGRRAALQAHLAACAACASFQQDLQATQDLALDLPVFRVGRDFRDQLWARIESGEAAPDVPVLPPVPFAAKLRYLLLGAAAAAAAIAVVRLGFPGANDEPDPPSRLTQHAPAEPAGPAQPPAAMPMAMNDPPVLAQGKPLHPYWIARHAAETTAEGASALKRLQSAVEDEDAEAAELRAELQRVVNDLRGPVRVMDWLVQKDFIALSDEFRNQFTRLETTLSLVDGAEAMPELRVALRGVRELDPDGLRSRFFVLCCEGDKSDLFVREFELFNRLHPEDARMLRIEIRVFPAPGPQQGLFFVPEPPAFPPREHGAVRLRRRAPASSAPPQVAAPQAQVPAPTQRK